MGYDWTLNRAVKHLDTTPFASTLKLPDYSCEVKYGLYAVVVHKGQNANSGHYVTYARHSSAPDINRRNSEMAPWVVFNDSRVAASSWNEMVTDITTSPHDTTYMLFYRKGFDMVSLEEVRDDEDKLLQHAIHLSSSLSSSPLPQTSLEEALQSLSSFESTVANIDPMIERIIKGNQLLLENLELSTSLSYRELLAVNAMNS